jgi:hypothetical protein
MADQRWRIVSSESTAPKAPPQNLTARLAVLNPAAPTVAGVIITSKV